MRGFDWLLNSLQAVTSRERAGRANKKLESGLRERLANEANPSPLP